MSKIYDANEHTFVMIKHDYYECPYEIVLHCGDFVFIKGSCVEEINQGIKRVSDDRCLGFDQHGNCILSIPIELCSGFYTDEEAKQIANCIDADYKLLSYARG